jgi:hypothetical protein
MVCSESIEVPVQTAQGSSIRTRGYHGTGILVPVLPRWTVRVLLLPAVW